MVVLLGITLSIFGSLRYALVVELGGLGRDNLFQCGFLLHDHIAVEGGVGVDHDRREVFVWGVTFDRLQFVRYG